MVIVNFRMFASQTVEVQVQQDSKQTVGEHGHQDSKQVEGLVQGTGQVDGQVQDTGRVDGQVQVKSIGSKDRRGTWPSCKFSKIRSSKIGYHQTLPINQ